MKLIYMADGLFLYEKENSYVVMDQHDNVLKELKTSTSCARYILKTLQSRRAAERYAIEKTNQDKNQSRAV
jgi:hypothetical protein